MSVIKFTDVWNNHPNITGSPAILDSKVYENQCAINLSFALLAAGLKLNNFHGTRSWQENKPKLPIRAQELADWLDRFPAGLPHGATKFKKDVHYDKKNRQNLFEKFPLKGQSGIVFFQNYYGVGLQGDHIDLWNGSRMTDMSSYFRIHHNFTISGLFENLYASQTIWFWVLP